MIKIRKTILGELERVYATAIMDLNDTTCYLVASEGPGECRSIHSQHFGEEVIWDGPGGTMNIVPVPNKKNEFIATQKFLPTFDAKESEIVHVRLTEEGQFMVTPIMTIPYLHRFDLFFIEGKLHLIGGVLCKSKAYKDDWSDPGKVVVGRFNDDITTPFELVTIYDGLTKNHGFCRTVWEGREVFFITAVEGAFIFTPPTKLEEAWGVEHLFEHEISDCAIVDIDKDGQPEIATIEGFHGDKGRIYKKINNQWTILHEHMYEFGHVVWGGQILGEPAFIIGARKGKMETILFTYSDGEIIETLIDNVGGPSNIVVKNDEHKDIILAANRQIGEYCIYEITKG